jgi:4-hydroxybenzoate polyprenyltransferase
MSELSSRNQLPGTARVVAIVLIAGGALYGIVATLGVSQGEQAAAALSIAILALGAICMLVGWRLLNGDRWAYIAAIVVLALAVLGGVVNAIGSGDRAVLAQVFLPGVGLWLLLRSEVREYFGP